jgi:hypothetical protein
MKLPTNVQAASPRLPASGMRTRSAERKPGADQGQAHQTDQGGPRCQRHDIADIELCHRGGFGRDHRPLGLRREQNIFDAVENCGYRPGRCRFA